jgi:hypothetical protein
MNFDRGGQNLPAQRRRALLIGQRLQKEFDRLTDIDECLLDGLTLRLAPLQFRALRVAAMLVLFDYDADLPVINHHSTGSGSLNRMHALLSATLYGRLAASLASAGNR